MPVKVELTIEQLAATLKHLKKSDIETLELMLSEKTEKEILKRRKEARAGKRVSIDGMSAFKDI